MLRLPHVFVLSALRGAALGYLGNWLHESYNVERYGASYGRYEHEWVSVFALPGVLVDIRLYERDYRLGEQWLLGLHSVALYNALAYLMLTVTVAALLRIVSRRRF
jgi:hypothetical protein